MLVIVDDPLVGTVLDIPSIVTGSLVSVVIMVVLWFADEYKCCELSWNIFPNPDFIDLFGHA